ncbi:potassium channel protein [Priestia megaterium]|nr:potassium channel protein [Priestia megaterium]
MSIFFWIWKSITKMQFRTVFSLSVTIVLFGTLSIYLLERENFPTLFEGLWWTMTTLTTVGYGDYYPTTVLGRLLGMFLFIFGIGIIGLLISKVVDTAATYNRLKAEGKLMIKKEDHYIYIGWSKKTKSAINEVLANEPEAEIVLIENLEKTPIENDQVSFVQGDPSREDVLLKANILKSKRVAIFSDSSIDSVLLADGKTLLIASAVEGLSNKYGTNIHTIVEVSDETHIPKFKHIKIDDFVVSNDSVSMLMAKATLNPGTTNLFRQLLSKRYGSNIHEIQPKSEWITYEDAYYGLFEEGAILISVNENMDFVTQKKEKVKPEDIFYVVSNDEVFAKLR